MANNILKEMIEAGCKVNYFDFSQNNGTINIRIGTDGFKIENSKPKASTPETATKEEVKKAEVPVLVSTLPSVNTPQEEEEEVVDDDEVVDEEEEEEV